MNDTNKYTLDSIKTLVWSGFYDLEDVNEMIEDILEDDADGSRSAILSKMHWKQTGL
jgi:hypothetical protein